MGFEALIIATSAAEAASRRGTTIRIKRPAHEPTAEDKVKELFADLELPYDLTGVEILREYLMSLGKEHE